MKLNVSFDALFQSAKKMGAKPVEIEFQLEYSELDPVDSELASGKEIELKDIDFISGFPSHKGRQVLLYIKDHSWKSRVNEALVDGSKGNKFHVVDCATIKGYRDNHKKRFDRYVITTNLSGNFLISGINQLTSEYIEGEANLCVCKHCLSAVNYNGYSGNKNKVFANFNLKEFFSTYSSFFSHLPRSYAGDKRKENYTDDWNTVAGNYKSDKKFKCQQCKVDLTSNKNLLHVHHQSGVKSDNSRNNLIALCADCHRKEPFHGHLFIKQKDTALINKLRREQNILKNSDWVEAYEFADPSMNGLLSMCQKVGLSIPSVAYELLGDFDEIIAELELAWPKTKHCVVINKYDADVANAQGWKVWSMVEAIEKFYDFKSHVS